MSRRVSWRAAAAAGLGTLLAGFPLLAAGAIGTGGAEAFGLNPAPLRDGRTQSYFSLATATGQPVTATAIVSNLGRKTEKLKLSRSLGVTAANGGIGYTAPSGPCSGPSCWLAGVTRTLTLAPGTKEPIRFTVRVPAGTPHRQYLAGITAELAGKPKPRKIGRHGQTAARAVIVQQVTVGVAVTVGKLSQLRDRLAIPGVSGQAIGTMPRLNVALRDTGQTFSGGTGQASCTAAGRRHSFRVVTNTILPGDQAQIAVNAPSLQEGTTVPCAVRIHYGQGQTARWSGMVTLPRAAAARIVHTGPGAYSVIPRNTGIPGWAIALIAVGGVAIAGVAVLLIRMYWLGRAG